MDGPRAGGLSLASSDPDADVAADATRLAGESLERGATRAAVIDASSVALDPEAPANAHEASCACPGNLMSPPFAPLPEELARWLAPFRTAILLEVQAPLPGGERWAQGGRGWCCRWQRIRSDPVLRPAALAAWKQLHQVTMWLERECMRRGYYLAVGFGAADCELCEVCETSELCAEPYAARPSMEAVGIDVPLTRAAAGWGETSPGRMAPAAIVLMV